MSNLLSDCFFRQELPPFASKLQSKNKLKSPANIIGLFSVRWKFSNRFVSSKKVVSWSFLVLALYKLIHMNSVSSINASIIKICPCLSDAFFPNSIRYATKKSNNNTAWIRFTVGIMYLTIKIIILSSLIFLRGMCFLQK